MDKRLLLTFVAMVLITTSCTTTANEKAESSIEAPGSNIARESDAASFQLEPLTEAGDFPVELVNQIREAVYQNKVEVLIAELSGIGSIMPLVKIAPDQGLYEAVDQQQIIYGRKCARFQYDSKDFLMTYDYDYRENLVWAALFLLGSEDDKLTVDAKVYFKEQKRLSNGQIVYAEKDCPDVADILVYLQDCMEDAVWVSREMRMFFGDALERPDLLTKFKERYFYREIPAYMLCTIDADNDGVEEIYEVRRNQITGWYDKELDVLPKPYEEAEILSYRLINTWFKIINNKTMIFTIHEKKVKKDCYLIKVQIVENGETKTLLEYEVSLDTSEILMADNYFDTYQQREIVQQWQIPEYGEIFSDNITQSINDLVAEVMEYSYKINFDSDPNTAPVLEAVQQLISSQELYAADDTLGVSGTQLNTSAFYKKYYEYLKVYDPDSEGGFIPSIDVVYQREYADQIYDLLFYYMADSGFGNRVDVYLEEEEGLTFCSSNSISLLDSKIIQNSEGIFLVKKEKNREKEKYLPDITVRRLSSETEEIMVIRPDTTGFRWKSIYSDQLAHEAAVSLYLEQIKDDLMWNSVVPEKNQFYVGDESTDFDEYLQARLKSISFWGNDLYQTDYNNDGQADYILRLRNDGFKIIFYHVNDNWPVKINYENDNYGQPVGLIQTWFQEINGQVFTFQLFLEDEKYYKLNVTLMKGTQVTLVQSYLIVPEVEYYIE